MSCALRLNLGGGHESPEVEVGIKELILAGWTGRDQAAVQAHIEEMKLLGVAPPEHAPMFYRVSASLLTTAPVIEVIGTESTGEVEFVLLQLDGEIRVGLGSDQTDRKVESLGVTLAKQMCPKPIAPELWRFREVEGHWDELILRAYAELENGRMLYQEGKVSAMCAPEKLLALYSSRTQKRFGEGSVLFGGTFPVLGGIRWANCFSMELEDPVRKRRISHSYRIDSLPIEG